MLDVSFCMSMIKDFTPAEKDEFVRKLDDNGLKGAFWVDEEKTSLGWWGLQKMTGEIFWKSANSIWDARENK